MCEEEVFTSSRLGLELYELEIEGREVKRASRGEWVKRFGTRWISNPIKTPKFRRFKAYIHPSVPSLQSLELSGNEDTWNSLKYWKGHCSINESTVSSSLHAVRLFIFLRQNILEKTEVKRKKQFENSAVISFFSMILKFQLLENLLLYLLVFYFTI